MAETDYLAHILESVRADKSRAEKTVAETGRNLDAIARELMDSISEINEARKISGLSIAKALRKEGVFAENLLIVIARLEKEILGLSKRFDDELAVKRDRVLAEKSALASIRTYLEKQG